MDKSTPKERLKSFPVAQTGETVYSLFCRFAARTIFPNNIILESLTEQNYYKALLSATPGYLSTISSKVPKGHSWCHLDQIVEKNTSFPYFSYFDSPSQRQRAMEIATSNNFSNSNSMALGLAKYPNKATPKHPKFCSSCVETDLVNRGYAYFHREHQLPGVAICWRHGDILSHGCTECGPYPLRKNVFCLPGRCNCSNLNSPLLADTNLPADMATLYWLTEQSVYIVNSPGITCPNIRGFLRSVAMSKGFSKGSLLNTKKLAEALDTRYGSEALSWLGTPAFTSDKPSPWIKRLLYPQLQEQKRSPSILFLLIIGVLFSSVEEFEESLNSSTEETTNEEKPKAIEKETKDHKESRLRPNQINELVNLSKNPPCGIPGIAIRLGVKDADIVATIKKLKIRFPLTHRTVKRIGQKTIDAIRKDLEAGLEKKRIMAKHKCSEWSLTLIEFDNPSLTERHKIAARNRIREKHRSDLKERLKRDPKLTRQELQEVACGTYEALLDHDPEWFDQILPRKRPEQPAQRSARIDRKELDTKKSEEIEKFLVTIIDTEERPTRVTQTRLLRHVDILTLYRENPDKFPNVSKVILNNSETQEQHDKRKLKWAIKKMHKNYIELSLNTLRRVAGMRAEKVRDYKEFILNIADEIGAEVNDRAFFLN